MAIAPNRPATRTRAETPRLANVAGRAPVAGTVRPESTGVFVSNAIQNLVSDQQRGMVKFRGKWWRLITD